MRENSSIGFFKFGLLCNSSMCSIAQSRIILDSWVVWYKRAFKNIFSLGGRRITRSLKRPKAQPQRFSSLQIMQTWSKIVSVIRGASKRNRESIMASDDEVLMKAVRRVL